MTKTAIFKSTSAYCMMSFIFASAAAWADPVILTTPRSIDIQPQSRDAIVRPAVKATATVRNQSHAYSTPANVGLTAAAAISSFRLHFDNGDHALRSIHVFKAADQTAILTIADRFGDDPTTSFANWWVIPGAIGGELSTSITSGQELNLTVPVGPANHRLVLGGFSVRVDGETNSFETGEMQIGRLAIRLTDPAPQASNSAASRISGTVFTNDGNRRINVTVQYVWVPTTYLASAGSASNQTASGRDRPGVGISGQGASERNRNSIVDQLPPSDRYLIRAFDLKFNNGTHNMLDIGVHLNGATGTSASGEAISWQDNNRDDPIEWRVDYINLR